MSLEGIEISHLIPREIWPDHGPRVLPRFAVRVEDSGAKQGTQDVIPMFKGKVLEFKRQNCFDVFWFDCHDDVLIEEMRAPSIAHFGKVFNGSVKRAVFPASLDGRIHGVDAKDFVPFWHDFVHGLGSRFFHEALVGLPCCDTFRDPGYDCNECRRRGNYSGQAVVSDVNSLQDGHIGETVRPGSREKRDLK